MTSRYVQERSLDKGATNLLEYVALYELSLLGYCPMSNHVHLVVAPRKPKSLALAMKQTHGRHASYWNARHSSSGHAWQGCLYSCPMDQPHLWAVLRYAERKLHILEVLAQVIIEVLCSQLVQAVRPIRPAPWHNQCRHNSRPQQGHAHVCLPRRWLKPWHTCWPEFKPFQLARSCGTAPDGLAASGRLLYVLFRIGIGIQTAILPRQPDLLDFPKRPEKNPLVVDGQVEVPVKPFF